jgi:hypothetical protein
MDAENVLNSRPGLYARPGFPLQSPAMGTMRAEAVVWK